VRQTTEDHRDAARGIHGCNSLGLGFGHSGELSPFRASATRIRSTSIDIDVRRLSQDSQSLDSPTGIRTAVTP